MKRLGNPEEIGNLSNLLSLKLNDNLLITENNWSGKYFESVPIKIKAIPKLGYAFSHWSDESLLFYENLDLPHNWDIDIYIRIFYKLQTESNLSYLKKIILDLLFLNID